MKKRPIIFGILLILSIIFYCFTHCGSAKAEPYIGVESSDIPSMELPEWSFSPATPSPAPTATPTPGASETAAPGGEEQRSIDPSLQGTNLYTRQWKATYNPTNQVYTQGYTYVLFNDGGSAVLVGDMRNFATPSFGGRLQVAYDDDTGDEFTRTDFTHQVDLGYSYIDPTSVNFKYSSFTFGFYDKPTVELKGDYKIIYDLEIPMVNKVTIPNGAEDVYASIGLNNSSIRRANVTVKITVTGSQGTVIPFSFLYKLSDFYKGIKTTIEIEELSDDEYIDHIDIMYTILAMGDNNWFDALEAAFLSAGSVPSNDSLYGSWMIYSAGIKFQRIVKFSDSRNLIEKILAGIKHIFIPDPNILQQTVISLIPTEHEGAASYVFSLRDTIQNLFSSTPHAIITVPQFDFKLDYSTNDRGYRVWNAYTFDVTEFFDNNNTRLGRLIENLRVLINVTITFAFVNSVFSMVCSIFGLHWYKGVEAEDVGEADV